MPSSAQHAWPTTGRHARMRCAGVEEGEDAARTISTPRSAVQHARAASRQSARSARTSGAQRSGLVGHVAGHQRGAHPARQLVAGERRVLALAAQRGRLHRPARRGSNRHRSATPPSTSRPALERQRAQRIAEHAHRLAASRVASVVASGRPLLGAPLQRQAQQQLQPGGAGLGFGEGQVLRVVVDRRVVADQRVDGAVGQRRRGSRRGRAAGAAAASGASRR